MSAVLCDNGKSFDFYNYWNLNALKGETFVYC